MTNAGRPKSIRPSERKIQVVLLLVAAVSVSRSFLDFHWSIEASVVLAAFGWLTLTKRTHIPWFAILAIAAAASCLLTVQFGKLSPQSARVLTWGFITILVGILASSVWQLINAGIAANRGIREIRRDSAAAVRTPFEQ